MTNEPHVDDDLGGGYGKATVVNLKRYVAGFFGSLKVGDEVTVLVIALKIGRAIVSYQTSEFRMGVSVIHIKNLDITADRVEAIRQHIRDYPRGEPVQ